MDAHRIERWIAKTHEDGNHLALWHLIDVMAVAEALLAHAPICEEREANRALALLAGLHDTGKVSATFDRAIREGVAQPAPHWHLSAYQLEAADVLLAEVFPGEEEDREDLFLIAAGHHGEPAPLGMFRSFDIRQGHARIGAEAMRDGAAMIEVLRDLMPGARLALEGRTDLAEIGLRFAGLVTQADWIGSNPDWFPPVTRAMPPARYLEQARNRAAEAVTAAGVTGAVPAFAPRVLPERFQPTPMQRMADGVALPEGPAMVLIEDATGAGKTEAAVILASRMIRAGQGRGIFFGLPTMATSNALFGRAADLARAIFEGVPNLSLSHGRARMDVAARELRAGRIEGITSSDWISRDGRRALFADFGVGTIDQALMAVLPTKFCALRLHALQSRVLIIDEAHSYDPYMESELCRLLTFQARLGGSAIVMTATLPLALRDRFVAAWREGLSIGAGLRRGEEMAPVSVASRSYPAITTVGRSVRCQPVAAEPRTVRDVPVERIASPAAAAAAVAEVARQGGCALWIRNAVDDVIEGRRLVGAQGIEAEIVHARFALCDRLAKDAGLLARFGREGQGREGRVVVSSQVAEQSLDVDFDLVVSDLAPIGAIIQRAGRLWRHLREARPIAAPRFGLVCPHPGDVTSAEWLRGVMPAGRHVYPAAVQWRTARALLAAGRISAPGGLRDLIEAVHGAAAEPIPEILSQDEARADRSDRSDRAKAHDRLLDPRGRYDARTLGLLWEEETIRTRLGQPQTTLVLARWQNDTLIPWAEGQGRDAWAMSEVTAAASKLERLALPDQTALEVVRAKASWRPWQRDQLVLAPVDGEGRICPGLRYDREVGLRFE